MHGVHPPATIYRIARRGMAPFDPPPWEFASSDGTFGGRFDDPGHRATPNGERHAVSLEQRFRMIYAASTPLGAFGETLARVRPKLSSIGNLTQYLPDDPEPLERHLAASRDPDDPSRGLISAEWRSRRVLASAVVDPTLRCADVFSLSTINELRAALAPVATDLGLEDIDFSTMLGPIRQFTQLCARHIYEMLDADGAPLFAGLRYRSRLNVSDPSWECWAFFSDRIGKPMVHVPQTIFPDHPSLLEVASLYHLTVEVVPGEFLRP